MAAARCDDREEAGLFPCRFESTNEDAQKHKALGAAAAETPRQLAKHTSRQTLGHDEIIPPE